MPLRKARVTSRLSSLNAAWACINCGIWDAYILPYFVIKQWLNILSKADFPVPMPVSVVYTFANWVKGKNLNKSVQKEKTFCCACALPFSSNNFVISSEKSCSPFAGSLGGYMIKRKLESAHGQGSREGKSFKRCPSVQGTWQSRVSRETGTSE